VAAGELERFPVEALLLGDAPRCAERGDGGVQLRSAGPIRGSL
jgi:hypothetical protein